LKTLIPKSYSNAVDKLLRRLGVYDQDFDKEAYYDSTLTFGENMRIVRENVAGMDWNRVRPPSREENRATMLRHYPDAKLTGAKARRRYEFETPFWPKRNGKTGKVPEPVVTPYRRVRGPPPRPAWFKGKPPRSWVGKGFDTETYHGWARYLGVAGTDSKQDGDGIFVQEGDWPAIFNFLLDHGPRLVAWNLRFDAEAVLKHLGERALRRLFVLEGANIGPYSLELIPWKLLRLRRGQRSVEIFDVAPFYGSSLDHAAKKFLGEGKQEVDAANLNVNRRAWRAKARIASYCQKDAELTNRLCVEASNRFLQIGGSFDKPYSVAFVAADALMRDTMIPRLAPFMIAPAEAAFQGARFESLWRGRFAKAYAYDIKSAYPAHARNVEDARGRWVQSVRPHRDALHAIMEVEVHVPPDDYPNMAPIPLVRNNKPVVYPTGSFRTTILKATYDKFEDLVTPIRTWNFIPSGEIVKPYRFTLDKLLAFRASADKLLDASAKRAANSIYGKLLNQKLEKRIRLDTEWADHFKQRAVMLDGQRWRVERVKHSGLLYNPLHAGLITEGCRLQIWDACAPRAEDVLMIQADGVICRNKFLGDEKAQVPGDLGFVASGDTVVCGSGLYEIEGYARRTRGVALGRDNEDKGGEKAILKGASWFSILRGVKRETVAFTDVRPAHLEECLNGLNYSPTAGDVRKLGLKDANVFLPFTRELNVCVDEKRMWPRIGEARRLLGERFSSRPLRAPDEC